MRITIYLIAALTFSSSARGEELSISEWLDIMVDNCVGSGSTFTVDGKLDADVGIAIRKLGPSGNVAGQFAIKKSDYRLLQEGISNKMNEVAAGQASEVRKCLAGTRAILEKAMSQQLLGPAAATAAPSGSTLILSSYEERIMKALAGTAGEDGKAGRVVAAATLQNQAVLSDIRFSQP